MVEAPAGSYWYEDDVVEIAGDRNPPERVAWGDLVAQLRNRLELNTPAPASCQATRGKEHFGILEWAEKTIVDSAQEAGPEFDGERVARGPGRGADLESARIFIQLDDREVVTGLQQMTRNQKGEIIVVSPYLIPSKGALERLAAASEAGMEVRILAPTLAANNQAAAHGHYKKKRFR